MCNNNCRQGRDCTCGEFDVADDYWTFNNIFTENRVYENKIAELESELLEQVRIIGMSGEREADLLGKIDRLEREVKRLKAMLPQPHIIRELVNKLRDIAVKYHDHQSLRERLAAPVHEVWKTGEAND